MIAWLRRWFRRPAETRGSAVSQYLDRYALLRRETRPRARQALISGLAELYAMLDRDERRQVAEAVARRFAR